MLASKAIRGASWLVSSRLIGRVIDFVTLLFLARTLTPTDFGLTALAMTLIIILDTVLEVPVIQALISLQKLEKSHLDTGFTLGALRSLVVAAVVLIGAFPFSYLYQDSRLIVLIAVLAISPIARGMLNPNLVRFARNMRFRPSFITEFSGKLCGMAAAITIVLAGGGYWAIAANTVVPPVVSTIVSYLLAPYRPSITLSRMDDFAGYIGWFTGAQILVAVNWQFERLVLGRFIDKASLGRYALASDLAMFPSQAIVGPAMHSVLAAFSRISSEKDRLKPAFLKASGLAMLVVTPMCVGIAVTGDLIVRLLLGAKWQDAGVYLQLISLAFIAAPYYQTLQAFSLAVARPIILFRINLISLALRIPLVGFFVYFYSIMGAIAALISLSVIMFAFYLYYVRREVGIGYRLQLKNLWKVAVAASTMAAAVLFARHFLVPPDLNFIVELLLMAAIGAVVYASTLLASGVWLLVGQGRLQLINRWW
jgi:lipopolysaccharide exporter